MLSVFSNYAKKKEEDLLMKYKYFRPVPETYDDLRDMFRELAKEHHPDNGGNDEVMKMINAEHQELQPKLKHIRRKKPDMSSNSTATGDIKKSVKPSIIPIVETLESLIGNFNSHFYDGKLPLPVITLSKTRKKSVLGWCTIDRVWQEKDGIRYFEINLCPDHLDRPIEDICNTLLHEMVHLYNRENGIDDCSRNFRYHNKDFKKSAEQHGLFVEKHPNHGYAITTLRPETIDYIKSLNLSGFDLFRKEQGSENISNENGQGKGAKRKAKKSSSRKYICPQCKDLAETEKEKHIICGDCNLSMAFAG